MSAQCSWPEHAASRLRGRGRHNGRRKPQAALSRATNPAGQGLPRAGTRPMAPSSRKSGRSANTLNETRPRRQHCFGATTPEALRPRPARFGKGKSKKNAAGTNPQPSKIEPAPAKLEFDAIFRRPCPMFSRTRDLPLWPGPRPGKPGLKPVRKRATRLSRWPLAGPRLCRRATTFNFAGCECSYCFPLGIAPSASPLGTRPAPKRRDRLVNEESRAPGQRPAPRPPLQGAAATSCALCGARRRFMR